MRTTGLRRGVQAATGHINTSGDNVLIPAPGSERRIVVCYLSNQNNTIQDTTIITLAGATPIDTLLLNSDVPGRVLMLNSEDAWYLPENTALIQNLSAANDVLYTVRYYIESTGGI